jgi:hypothetical protein
MHGLALIGLYLFVALVGQVVGFGVSSLVERVVPWAGMPAFLMIFFGMLVLAWPIAVSAKSRLFPEPPEARVGSPVW